MENTEIDKRIKFIINYLSDKKGENPLVLDVRKFSNGSDYLIIIDGFVGRHVSAMGTSLVRAMKEQYFLRPSKVEGLKAGDWVLIDYDDIIVHIFVSGLRERYDLESLWSEKNTLSLV